MGTAGARLCYPPFCLYGGESIPGPTIAGALQQYLMGALPPRHRGEPP